MTVKNNRCHELGVCQGLSADQCPDCDSFECAMEVQELYPEPGRRSTDHAPLPTYPFAPGTIQGLRDIKGMAITMEDDDAWYPLSLPDLLKIVAVLVVLGAVAGYLVERFA